MRTVQVQTVGRSSIASASGFDPSAAFGRLKMLVAAVLGRRAQVGHDAVPHYEGYAWCDSLEQQVNGDVVTCRRPRY